MQKYSGVTAAPFRVTVDIVHVIGVPARISCDLRLKAEGALGWVAYK